MDSLISFLNENAVVTDALLFLVLAGLAKVGIDLPKISEKVDALQERLK